MGNEHHDELPVLPEEATSLKVHVRMCVRRHLALIRYHHELSRKMWRSEMITLIYRSIMLPAVGALLWKFFIHGAN